MGGQSVLDGLGDRLAQVIKQTDQNQSEFARSLGISAGFLSDVVRGLKKPGAEFLFSVRNAYDVSIDWLLSGEGSMKGNTRIDLELVRTVRLLIAIARSAINDGNMTAKALLLLIRDGRLQEVAEDADINAYLDELTPENGDFDLALELYNGQLWTDDTDAQRRNLLAAAIAHFEAKKPLDKMEALARAGGAQIQLNISSSQRVAGRDYHGK